uniref:Uncharacterized protein n=1 Tax=Romanomermis culicivorax TaxID=13658 RepID=A0A915HZQ3_ROMCU
MRRTASDALNLNGAVVVVDVMVQFGAGTSPSRFDRFVEQAAGATLAPGGNTGIRGVAGVRARAGWGIVGQSAPVQVAHGGAMGNGEHGAVILVFDPYKENQQKLSLKKHFKKKGLYVVQFCDAIDNSHDMQLALLNLAIYLLVFQLDIYQLSQG